MRGEQRIATIMDESIRRQDIPAKKTIRKLNNNIYGVKLRKKDLLAGNSIPISPTT